VAYVNNFLFELETDFHPVAVGKYSNSMYYLDFIES
jgi:hypothetical protein